MIDAAVRRRLLFGVVLALCVMAAVIAAWQLSGDQEVWPRGEPLGSALRPWIEGKEPERAMIARAIWENYLEARSNASRWSGVYWGFTFTAAVLSALAGVVLKLEFLVRNEDLKKDLAAVLAVGAALLIAISSSGDFQRKWQANRIAAAELERSGYQFLSTNGGDARSYLVTVGEIVLQRNRAIAGDGKQSNDRHEAADGTSK